MAKCYAIMDSRGETAILPTWEACVAFRDANPSGAKYKKCGSEAEAEAYLAQLKGQTMAPSDIVESAVKNKKIYGPGHAIAYTDGSYNPETHVYGYGVRLSDADDLHANVRVFSGSDTQFADSRNIGGECDGALRAVKEAIALGYQAITIRHDYRGVGAWVTGEWKNTNTPVSQNYKFQMDNLKPFIEINFEWVHGHSGEVFNDEVDGIAKLACGVV